MQEPEVVGRFDPADPGLQIDPYPHYARLRASAPVCRGGPGQWVVARYRDVAALLRDARLQNEFPPEYHRLSMGHGPAAEFLQHILIYRDRPRHTYLRKTIASSFDSGALLRLRSRIEHFVEECLEPALQRGALEVVAELALPLPVMVICEVIGIPAADRNAVRSRATDLAKTFLFKAAPEDRACADASVLWLRGYLTELARQRAPGHDLVSKLIDPCTDEPNTEREELLDNIIFLLFAGFETTSSLIANGCAALLADGRELERLKSDISLVPTAIEEFLRYDAPIQGRFRLVREPLKIGETIIRRGRLLLLLLGSANRDETQFAEPDKLDVTRRPNLHVSFGGGDHFCLGAALARAEAVAAFSHLLRRCRHIEPAGMPLRSVGSPFRTYERVPLTIAPS